MKKKLSLLLAFVLCLGLVPCAYADNSPFADVPASHWAYNEIMEAYNDEVMTGTATRTFSPDGKLDMDQFYTVLTRAFYSFDVEHSTRSGGWPNQNFDAADKHNLFNRIGYNGNTDVTREVMSQMMYNVMVDKRVILPDESEVQQTINSIPDLSSVQERYRTAVATCYYFDLLSGVDTQGTFAPKDILNRAQTAAIYVRLKSLIKTKTASATLTNGMPVTEENVLALMEEYRNGKTPTWQRAISAGFTSYAEHTYYDAYEPPYSSKIMGSNGIECAKLAFAFWDELFGSDMQIRTVTDIADAHPGDLIKYPGHWGILIGFKFWEWNGREVCSEMSVNGGPTGLITWDDDCDTFGEVETMRENIRNGEVVIYTRYPE